MLNFHLKLQFRIIQSSGFDLCALTLNNQTPFSLKSLFFPLFGEGCFKSPMKEMPKV